MDKGGETWKTVPKRPVSATNPAACLVHIYPSGAGMGTRFGLADTAMIAGRGEDCQLRLDDPSVSRRHLCIQPEKGDYYVIDLQSTNGTFVNDKPIEKAKLKDGDYLRIGNWIFRYLAGGNVEADYHEEIYRLTIIDGLTGIHNKRFLLEFLGRELARCRRYHRPLALILFDLDRFKVVNDELGHLAGDHALRELVNSVKSIIRQEELLARYGGEEFAVVLTETDREGALVMAERLRQLVEKHAFQFDGRSFQVTVSLGVISTLGNEAETPEGLIGLADEKLYQAKNAGRNCVAG